MTEERILTAVERIDGAMARIEAGVRRPAPLQGTSGAAELAALQQRHAAMRSSMEAAMGELDTLIRNG